MNKKYSKLVIMMAVLVSSFTITSSAIARSTTIPQILPSNEYYSNARDYNRSRTPEREMFNPNESLIYGSQSQMQNIKRESNKFFDSGAVSATADTIANGLQKKKAIGNAWQQEGGKKATVTATDVERALDRSSSRQRGEVETVATIAKKDTISGSRKNIRQVKNAISDLALLGVTKDKVLHQAKNLSKEEFSNWVFGIKRASRSL